MQSSASSSVQGAQAQSKESMRAAAKLALHVAAKGGMMLASTVHEHPVRTSLSGIRFLETTKHPYGGSQPSLLVLGFGFLIGGSK